MSDSGNSGLGAGLTLYTPSRPAADNGMVAHPHVGSDDHQFELAESAPRNRLGDAALLAALVGVVLVWALQDSVYLVGFIVSGLAFLAAAVALFLPRRRRAFAVGGLVIGALPFLFTLARALFGF
jgi:hypothetical protein